MHIISVYAWTFGQIRYKSKFLIAKRSWANIKNDAFIFGYNAHDYNVPHLNVQNWVISKKNYMQKYFIIFTVFLKYDAGWISD